VRGVVIFVNALLLQVVTNILAVKRKAGECTFAFFVVCTKEFFSQILLGRPIKSRLQNHTITVIIITTLYSHK
jgi:hypothetical protein